MAETLILITLTEFRKRLGNISRVTLWRLRKRDQNFPTVKRITPGKLGVNEREANAYVASRPTVDPLPAK
jgi:predicted DNA-binding transcriptional regulator AlpA